MCLLSVTVASLSGSGLIINVGQATETDFTCQSVCRPDGFQPHPEM